MPRKTNTNSNAALEILRNSRGTNSRVQQPEFLTPQNFQCSKARSRPLPQCTGERASRGAGPAGVASALQGAAGRGAGSQPTPAGGAGRIATPPAPRTFRPARPTRACRVPVSAACVCLRARWGPAGPGGGGAVVEPRPWRPRASSAPRSAHGHWRARASTSLHIRFIRSPPCPTRQRARPSSRGAWPCMLTL